MNIVLLVNTLNLADIRAFVEAAAALQTTKAHGAVVAVYQKRIGEETVKELVDPLFKRMSAGGLIPAPINGEFSNDGRNASLFAFFISQGYVRYPGPWLVVDGPGIPTREDFIQALEHQHGGLGGSCSGRFAPDGVANIPIGPVVIGVPVSQLSWFTQGGRESWRASMRFMLSRCGFKVVPVNDYLFSLPSAVALPAAQAAPPAEPPVPPSPPVFDPATLDPDPVASPQAVEAPEVGVKNIKDPIDTDSGNTLDPGYEEETREVLLARIESRGLDKPHHATGIPKLITILKEDDMSRHGAAPTA